MKDENIEEIMDVPNSYQVISVPKLNISEVIKEEMSKQNITIRSLAESVGMKHPQIVRVTSAHNYNIDTLLKILDGLGLEITINKKRK